MNKKELKILKNLVAEGYRLKAQHSNSNWRKALEAAESLIIEHKKSSVVEPETKEVEKIEPVAEVEKGLNPHYKGFVDDEPVEVVIIQTPKGGMVEIIRKENVKNRTNYAGFWVGDSEIVYR